MSDWIRDLLWNAGAYVGVAAMATLIVLGIRWHARNAPILDVGVQTTVRSRIGLSWDHWRSNIARGLTMFIWLTPVILCIHAAFSMLLWNRPHALAALGTANLSALEWSLVAFQACLAVPVIEEVLFRGLLQYWLARTSLLGHGIIMLATLARAVYGVAYHDAETDQDVTDCGPVIFAALLVAGYVYALYELKSRFGLSAAEVRAWKPIVPEGAFFETTENTRPEDALREKAWHRMTSRLSVYGSAMLFAILHVDAWPSPIALFVMGLGLGVLARSTQSLIGPIVFHAAFNLVAFIVLFGTSP